jgi:hypothetical protein
MDIKTQLMFATPVWTVQFDDCRMMNKKLLLDTTEYNAIGEWTLFNIDREGVNEFKQRTSEIGQQVARNYGIKFNDMQIRGRQHVREPLGSDPPHHHPYAEGIVGVYYLKVSENCGDLLIHDARGSMPDIWQDPYVKETRESNRKNHSGLMVHRVKPEIGKFILFPSYAIHSVETNLSNDLRISLIVEFRYLQ